MTYSEERKAHLEQYAQKSVLKNAVGGTWHGNGKYDHILKIRYPLNKAEQREVIEKYQLKPFGLSLDLFPVRKLQSFAHHLNSSQMLCYCYFRRLMDDKRHPKEELISLLSQNGINISETAVCSFEYDGYKKLKDGTEFDFHIKDDNVEIFFEIKYTERSFGKANLSGDEYKRHLEKFRTIYIPLLKQCSCLDENGITPDDFFESYQLYRNVVRVTDKNKYVIFLFPSNHDRLNHEYEDFHKKILDSHKDNVKALYWEELITEDNEPKLFEKYFGK